MDFVLLSLPSSLGLILKAAEREMITLSIWKGYTSGMYKLSTLMLIFEYHQGGIFIFCPSFARAKFP